MKAESENHKPSKKSFFKRIFSRDRRRESLELRVETKEAILKKFAEIHQRKAKNFLSEEIKGDLKEKNENEKESDKEENLEIDMEDLNRFLATDVSHEGTQGTKGWMNGSSVSNRAMLQNWRISIAWSAGNQRTFDTKKERDTLKMPFIWELSAMTSMVFPIPSTQTTSRLFF